MMWKNTFKIPKLCSYHAFLIPLGLWCLVVRLSSLATIPTEPVLGFKKNEVNMDGQRTLSRTNLARKISRHSSDVISRASSETETLKMLASDAEERKQMIFQDSNDQVIDSGETTTLVNDHSGENASHIQSDRNSPRNATSIDDALSNNPQTTLPVLAKSQSFSVLLRSSLFPGIVNTGSPTEYNRKTEESTGKKITHQQFVNLTTEHITQCFKKGDSLELYASSGQISFSGIFRCCKCNIKLTVPGAVTLGVNMSLETSICTAPTLRVNRYVIYNTYLCPKNKTHIRLPNPSMINIAYDSRCPKTYAFVQLFINFTSFPLKVFTSPVRGYVYSPNWDGHTRGRFDVMIRVHVPTNHSIMLSFLIRPSDAPPFGTCDFQTLKILTGDQQTHTSNCESLNLALCEDYFFPKPKVLRVKTVCFHYRSYFERKPWIELPFKILFSFHNVSAVPQKTVSGKWNCSVAYWPDFRQHLGICNTVDECFGAEDEANCSHVYQECRLGSVLIGGRCYQLVVQDRTVTWKEAANECLRRDAYLASLNTPDEWDDVIGFFSQVSGSAIYFGLGGDSATFPELYQTGFRWSDESFAYYFKLFIFIWEDMQEFKYARETCSILYYRKESKFLTISKADLHITNSLICEKQLEPIWHSTLHALHQIRLNAVYNWRGHHAHVICPAGHIVLKFLACDVKSKCFSSQTNSPSKSWDASVTQCPPYFMCDNDVQRVSYTLVCDHRPDCIDSSDENFCLFPACHFGTFQCDNQQCVQIGQRCDLIKQCADGSDEFKCLVSSLEEWELVAPRPPAVVDFDGYGRYEVKSMNLSEVQTNNSDSYVCPETHFLCPGKWTYCMPVHVRCNSVVDCPGREDEAGCDNYVCPGFYRCRASPVCIHADHVCDGKFSCPQHDDELLCDLSCPRNCSCPGLSFFCSGTFHAEDFPEIRFLDAEGSEIAPEDLTNNTMLIFLNLARCGLMHLKNVEFPNLHTLDLSRNQLRLIETNSMFNRLQRLSLAGNPLSSPFISILDAGLRFPFLKFLDMSKVSLETLNISIFSVFPNLVLLNLSGCGVDRVIGEGFQSLIHLKFLDLEKCPMTVFPQNIFGDIQGLTEVWADNYRLCCSVILPSLTNCHSPSDEISSCDALLRSNFYRVMLSVFASLTLLGNLCSFVYRVLVNRAASNSGFGTFVTHLSVSDFLMGVYLAVVGVADRVYMGTYLWNDTAWKHSAACNAAGFLALLSSEVSAFIICLITLDRFLVLRFPFSRLYFRKRSARLACGAAWLTGVILAGIPLLPMTSHWEYYSQTGICIPLPITRHDFAGYHYSFSVTIIVNFVLFLLIAAGQAFIYWSVRTNSVAAGDSTKASNNLTIARRLITIAMSDFLCWFPIGLLGLLASNGVPVPGEVNVLVAMLLLPVNSAINPFLYTLNTLLEARRLARERRIQKMIQSAAVANKSAENVVGERLEDARHTKEQALQLLQTWVAEGLVPVSSLEDVIIKHA